MLYIRHKLHHRKLYEIVQYDCNLKLIIGIDLPTPVAVFKKLLLLEDESIEARVFLKPTYFHPKLYLTSGKNKVAFISSHKEAFGFIVESTEFAILERIKFSAMQKK